MYIFLQNQSELQMTFTNILHLLATFILYINDHFNIASFWQSYLCLQMFIKC